MKAIITLSSAVLLSVSLLSWAGDRQAINESVNVAANEKIYIEAMRGDITIKAVSANTFRVKGKLDEKSEGFELKSENGFTHFEVKMPRSVSTSGNRDKGSELEIEVPTGSEVEFKGVNSRVNVSGITGSSKVTTVNGDIRAERLSHLVTLSTVNGEISSKQNSGRLELKTVNGKIDDTASEGRLTLTTVNGEIKSRSRASDVSLSVVNGGAELELSGLSELKMSAVNGDLDINVKDSASPRISGSSVSGDIELKLPQTVSAKFSLTASAGGNIKNELTRDQVNKAKYGPGRSLQFTLGQGEGLVELTTVSGKLELDK
ncbi:DUF4097 family beta strand repeat-containing protein [Chromatiaceae bacterium AAb-1]|nr:DUF4097 family beta strand repeat-containing protein [Chromatiaceae bacterium AAb-1]